MLNTDFIDYVKIYLSSGKGGSGAVHFRREKFISQGGPDGGNGGKGGSIWVRADRQFNTLLHLKYKKHIQAEAGKNGLDAQQTGASGKDIVIPVPLGTIIKSVDNDEIQVEVTQEQEQYLLLPGGQGGLGNAQFKTATRQAPRFSQPGLPGMQGWFIFELKLLADVGLVGLPNAGKSTLLSVISAAKPKIADYAFTTLVPNLGVVAYHEHTFVVADMPGLIQGASTGKGLGTRFLRHIERTKVLAFVISVDTADTVDRINMVNTADTAIYATYQLLLKELAAYDPELLNKKRLLVLSKADLLTPAQKQQISAGLDIPHVWVSALTHQGLDSMKAKLWQLLPQLA